MPETNPQMPQDPAKNRSNMVTLKVIRRSGNQARTQDSPDTADPRLVDYESGKLIADAVNPFVVRTGISIPQIAEKIGIGKENIYAYRRGHQVPSDATRINLERFLGLPDGALKSSGVTVATGVDGAEVSRKIVGDDLVITTTIRIPLSELR
jgi:ribosome-binding protein aMBF1 (putative translation factor)